MKKNFLLSTIVCFSLLFCLALTVALAEPTSVTDGAVNNTYTISNSYDYAVKPNTAEWKKFTSAEEKVKASQIPESTLSKMTTKALVETVINYPLLVNMYAFDTEQEGFNVVYGTFNGLQELTKRSDAILELEQYQNKLGYTETQDLTIIAQRVYVKTLLKGIGSNSLVSPNSVITPYYTNSM